MRAVVSDTGPLHYLVLIEQADILPRLFTTVFVPTAVRAELNHAETPGPVRQWLATERPWLVVRSAPATQDPTLLSLDDGERAAISLAAAMNAELLLMDDRAGVAVARARGLAATGTLGVLVLAARQGLLDLGSAVARLKATNFRYRLEFLDSLLARERHEPTGEA